MDHLDIALLEDAVDALRRNIGDVRSNVNGFINREEESTMRETKRDPILWTLAIIGVIAAVAAIAYAVYRYFTPDYLEDYDDDYDDRFDDDFFDDEEEDVKPEKKED
ncbi:MAG: DUF4366 domain-containing protein [Lachnospiraceae bacterium]|nr:DUF4366 domain-containing protein [Lachnospiraceae bacterium]